jgi:hypothetical protein
LPALFAALLPALFAALLPALFTPLAVILAGEVALIFVVLHPGLQDLPDRRRQRHHDDVQV